MKKRLIVGISSIAVLCALAIPVIHSVPAKAAPSPAARTALMVPDRHPEYHEALEALRNARKHLEKAEADGYGNRERALRSVDAAIDACNQALEVLR